MPACIILEVLNDLDPQSSQLLHNNADGQVKHSQMLCCLLDTIDET